ncbi:protein Flattop isoform X1 [Anolis carolinensis]|uniref:protein Flattop isoform X1 n=1 Tax=Anolis carolinensis TaxID=28377 RepID=UPI000462B60D|nr:PREDICTED: protein Flattop [Anolis carolinensis]|eukprot:XP_008121959.1 PREDICTED: protein Flattop [Anolis carolinensis]
MATHYSSGQYEDAYAPQNLRNWGLPRVTKAHPSAREGYTQFIADDKGHLLPLIPRSKASPWGTYLGTWDMPLKIPPAKVNLTCRSVDAAARLTEWVNKAEVLRSACNGFSPEIVGKPSDPPAHPTKETSAKLGGPSSRGSEGKMPAQEVVKSSGAATPKHPLSRQPGSIDVRLKKEAPPDVPSFQQPDPTEVRQRSGSQIPLSRQPGSMDVRVKDTASLKTSATSRPNSREFTPPRRTISAEAPALSRPRSLEGKAKGVSTSELLASCRPGTMEANPKSALSLEALSPSRPATKASHVSEISKDGNRSEREGATKSRLEETSS